MKHTCLRCGLEQQCRTDFADRHPAITATAVVVLAIWLICAAIAYPVQMLAIATLSTTAVLAYREHNRRKALQARFDWAAPRGRY